MHLQPTIIHNSPVAFVKLAEMETGEIDMTIAADHHSINYTLISHTLEAQHYGSTFDMSLHSPRYQGTPRLLVSKSSYVYSDCIATL